MAYDLPDRTNQRGTDGAGDHQAARRIVAGYERSAGPDHDVTVGVVVPQHFRSLRGHVVDVPVPSVVVEESRDIELQLDDLALIA